MPGSFFSELKRFTRFGPDDEEALAALRPHALAHAERIADGFFARLAEHHEAISVFVSPAQVEHTRRQVREWVDLLVGGPWDDTYFDRRLHAGAIPTRHGLPHRYMVAGVNFVRLELDRVAEVAFADDAPRRARAQAAVGRLLDLELAFMLESIREAHVDPVREREREREHEALHHLALNVTQYEHILESTRSLVVIFDTTGRVHMSNRQVQELVGLSRAEFTKRNFFDLFVPAAERAVLRGSCAELIHGTKRFTSWEGGSLSSTAGAFRARWHFTTVPGARNERLLCALGLDVTGEFEMGIRTRRAERLASLGTMAAGLAHELRNPLNAAHLQLTLMQRRLCRPSGPDVQGALGAAELVSAEMQRLASLVESFLQFGRPQPLNLARVDLRATAKSVVQAMGPAARTAGAELALRPGEVVLATADGERIKQMLHHLIQNAIEATGRGGHVYVGVVGGGAEARIDIEDDGPGLPSLDAPIFEPFYTTKNEGTGLGLAIVHRIVSDHGGRVGVESRPGRTVFSIHVPTIEG